MPLRPFALHPGDIVGLAAPSSPFFRERFVAGLRFVTSMGFRVNYWEDMFESDSYLAGSDERRVKELHGLACDPRVKAVLPARGGFGTMRLLPDLDPALFRRNPKFWLGFSDLTGLHAFIWSQTKLNTCHSPQLVTLPEAPKEVIERLLRLLGEARPFGSLFPEALEIWKPGKAEGLLYVGNLTLLANLVGTPYFPSLDGAILAIEDVNEEAYKIDRMLTRLDLAGAFDRLSGLIAGVFNLEVNQDSPDELLQPVKARLLNLAEKHGFPVFGKAPFGHVSANYPIPSGLRARMDDQAGTVEILEAACRENPKRAMGTGWSAPQYETDKKAPILHGLPEAEKLLLDALSAGVFSAAQLLVRRGEQVLHHAAYGKTHFGAESRPVQSDTLFDLASLTKVLTTTTLAALMVRKGLLDLDAPLGGYLPAWNQGDKAAITARRLLCHGSGLPAWRPYYETLSFADDPRRDLFDAVSKEALERKPGEQSVYSDLGFIALTELLEKLGGERLDTMARRQVFEPLGCSDLFYLPLGEAETQTRRDNRSFAASGEQPRRGLRSGEVHDENTFAVGGVMGHAGLFGTALAVDRVLQEWKRALWGEGKLLTPEIAKEFVYPDNLAPRGSHALGWDRPTWKISQAGRFISPHAIGHLGFTGVSAWLDHDRDLSIVLLTNRTLALQEDGRIVAVRKAVHESIYRELQLTTPGPFGPVPKAKDVHRIHLVGVAGTGMGSLAGMLKESGRLVTGSDQAIYPPMSILLAEQGIEVKQPFAASNLEPPPDLTVVGNVCSRDHVEVLALRKRGLPHDSFPGVLEHFFLADKKPLVVAGTHGKTTTSSMTAWLLKAAGLHPGFMIGGLVRNFGTNYRLDKGRYFVVEGDEYDSAYFDKYPKFMHYRPFGAILTSIEFDHADIYDSLAEIEERFTDFVRLIPAEGRLMACYDYETVRRAASMARCPVFSYGRHPEALWRAENERTEGASTHFRIIRGGNSVAEVSLPMTGSYNVDNAVAAFGLLFELGVKPEKLARGMSGFAGVARRQQVAGIEGGVRVIDDFAHHPTAVRLTLDALRRAYPEGRLLAAFDPRSNTSSRNVFQREFAESFDLAAFVAIGNPSRMDRIPPEQRLDVARLAADLRARGVAAQHLPDLNEMAQVLVREAHPGDTIAFLSNGGFGGVKENVLERLAKRH